MMTKVEKIRLDVLLAQRELAESRNLAQKLIMAGEVRVAGQVVTDPGRKVAADAELAVDKGPRFVSRGGEKLEPAMAAFGLDDLSGRVCADVGASTGGFTDCMLQHGALKVYAIDVGYGILHWKLRSDPRVVVMERTNARGVESLPEHPALVTVDASFISLRILLPVIRGWFGEQPGEVVALIKPQFEAGKEAVDRGEGVIHDPQVHRQVLEDVLVFALEQKFAVRGLVKSSLKGPKGNTEFLVHLTTPGADAGGLDRIMIENALRA
jgi:23S rRNA (cytidine1920-2'-O)/16S rRNA (cytidine1409-2'-O)-methyltransferase